MAVGGAPSPHLLQRQKSGHSVPEYSFPGHRRRRCRPFVVFPHRSEQSSSRCHGHVLRSSIGEEEAGLLAAPLLKQVVKYAVPIVLALVILRHQPDPEALFIKNPAPLWSFVAATAVYWLAAEATARGWRRYRGMLRRAAFVFGIQSLVSLVSMFLAYPLSLLPLLIPVPFALLVACTPISTLLVSVISKIGAMALRNNQPHILPV